MKQIIGTGLSGLVGSKFVSDFADKYNFVTIDRKDFQNPIDILDVESLKSLFDSSDAEFVVHLAAYTNVTQAWAQTGDKDGAAYQVNVVGTENIAQACQKTGKHLIHVSTAYVFDGNNPNQYQETDAVSPIEWYGQTKAWAEDKIMVTEGLRWTILRIDQPFRSDLAVRPDIVQRIISSIQTNSLPPQFVDHFFGPTYIDDFVKTIDWAIRTGTTGLFHASSGEKWSDFEFATLINQVHNLGGDIRRGSLSEYLKNTTRPYQKNTSLNCQKLFSKIDFQVSSIKDAIKDVTL